MKYILLLILLCLPGAASASIVDVKQIVVPVTLTYHGRSVNVLMAIDTGASITTIDRRIADKLGVSRDDTTGGWAQMADGTPARYYSTRLDVAASSMKRKNSQVNVMEYSGNRQADGWLGLNFLAEMTMTIDWRNKRIYWSE